MKNVSQGLVRAGDILAGNRKLSALVAEALAAEAEQAHKSGHLGFMARALVQATMPHRKPKEHFFERSNGVFTLEMTAPSRYGLPYGSIPRLLMVWMTTEAVKTSNRTGGD